MKYKVKQEEKKLILKVTFFTFAASVIYPIFMMVINSDISVFIPSIYIIIPLVLYVLCWIGFFAYHLRKNQGSFIPVIVLLLIVGSSQTLMGYFSIQGTISFIVTQSNLESEKISLKIIELIDYNKKVNDKGECIVLQHNKGQAEIYISFELAFTCTSV